MGWGAEGSAYAVTGALFLLCGAIASGPAVRARRPVTISMLIVAAGFIAAAFLSRTHGGWASTSWAWFVALVPATLVALLGVRATVGVPASHSLAKCLAPQRSAKDRATMTTEEAEAAATARLHKASDPHASGAELADLAYAHPELRVVIATNPATPANVLGWLASNGSEEISGAIATRSSNEAPSDMRRFGA
jgi:lysylphosphatidylglycerol synthetase-like protein (DUF2156 family)